MKKILIVNNNMHLGGVQKALVNLLRCIHEQYDITLVLFHPAGELMKEIPEDVKIVPVRSAYRFLGMTGHDVRGSFLRKLGRSFFAGISRIFGRDAAISLMARGQKKLAGFDVAVSFLHDGGDKVFYGGCNDFVLRHVQARKKVTFLHCDYSLCGADTPKNARRYARFDTIAACSDGCRRIFTGVLPELAEKTVTVYNCQDYDGICRAAESDPVCLPRDRINIVTVARLGREKGVERAVEALGRLGGISENWHYYIIGDGILRPQIEEQIRMHRLEDRITMAGEMSNPYGYMKAADLLLIPSLSEAAPMVIGEAAYLGTPVLSARTSSAEEMITRPGYGWVCENSTDGIAAALAQLLTQRQLIEEKKSVLNDIQPDNQTAQEQFSGVL